MLAELTAIRAALAALGVPVGIGDMTGKDAPFVSVWGSPGNRPSEESVAGPCGSLGGRVGITCTAARMDAAIKLASDAVDLLTPDRLPGTVPVSARHVVVEFVEAQQARVDSTITLPRTNTHPVFVVVLFDVDSQPA